MKHRAFCFLLFLLPFASQAQQCRFGGPLTIRPNDSLTVQLGVFGVALNNLASPAQGLCEVRLNFLHNAILDFEVWLTSPAGQTVQLIGPNSTINTVTLGSRWNITFVPCSSTAQPDPPFQSRWDNQLNNFPAGNYSGSYYPFAGCLESFNTGPVNGTWTLKLKTAPTAVGISGRLSGFELIFCEELGRNCCFADAGRIAGPAAVTGCQGDSSLLFIPQAQYPAMGPDTSLYAYTWMLGKDSVFLQYGNTFDLRAATPGNYRICGLSYDKADLDSLPAPNTVLRHEQFRASLDSPTPPFCGDVTDTCVQITILPPPDTGLLQRAICEGDSLVLGGSAFRNAGVFFPIIPSVLGCDSVVRLELTIIPPKRISIDTQICQGGAVRVGLSEYRAGGMYVDTLRATDGCDSIVSLRLTVVSLPLTFDTVYICQGTSYTLGGQTFNAPGDYLVPLSTTQQCDSLVNLTIRVLAPRAILDNAAATVLTCARPEIVLDGSASQPAGQLRFRWEGMGGMALGSDPVLRVPDTGRYVLQVIQEVGGVSCASQTSINIRENRTTPEARINGPDTLSCRVTELLLNGQNFNAASNAAFQWLAPNQASAIEDSTTQYRVDRPGTYRLVARDRSSGCPDTAAITIVLDTLAPLALAGPDIRINCASPEALLFAGGDTLRTDLQFIWTNFSGDTLSQRPSVLVSSADTYILEVINTRNGCLDADIVQVSGDFQRPGIALSAPDFGCGQDSVVAQAAVAPLGPSYILTWSGPGVRGSEGLLRQAVYAPGMLALRVENPQNGCVAEDSIMIGQGPCAPCLEALRPDTITCNQRLVRLEAVLCRPCATCTFSWEAPGGGRIVQDGATLQPVVSGGGLFRLTARDNNGLFSTLDMVVPVDTLPPLTEAGPDTSLTCSRTMVRLGNPQADVSGQFDYFWSTTSGAPITNPSAPVVTVRSPGRYFLAQKLNRNGCSALDSVLVGLDTLSPLADAGQDLTLTCAMPRASLDGSASSAGFRFRYAWQASGGGRLVAGAQSVTPLVDAAGLYTLTVLDTANGCSARDSVRVNALFTGPFIADIPDQTLNCLDTVLQVAAQLPDNRAYSFRWCQLLPNGDSICQPGLVAEIRTPGRWLFALRDSITGCSSFKQIQVRADTVPPVIDAGPSATLLCNLPQLALNGNVGLPAGQFEAEWTSSGGLILSGANTLQPQVSAPGWYVLRARSLQNFCIFIDSVLVAEDTQRPQAMAGRDTSLTCLRTSLRLQGATSFPTNNLDWIWETADGRIIGDPASLNPLIDRGGTYIFTVRNRLNGCLESDTVLVRSDTAAPRAVLTSEGPFLLTCRRDTLSLDGGPSQSATGALLNYTWQAIGPGRFNTLAPERILVQQPGLYRLRVRDAANGCTDSIQVQVEGDFILPLIQIQSPQMITCARPETVLEAWVSGPERRYSYTWTTPEGNRLPEDTSSVRVSIPGQYLLLVTNNRTGCFAEQTISVRADRQAPVVVFGAIPALDCDTREVALNASASRGRRLSFAWEALEGRLEGSADGPVAMTSSEGRYVLTLTDGENGCTASDTATVTASGNFIERADFELVQPGCGSGQGGRLFVVNVIGGKAPFRFRLDNRLSDAAGRFVNIPPGNYLFTVTDSEGCFWSSPVTMEEPQLINVELGPDIEIQRGDSAVLEALVFPLQPDVQFQWTGLEGISAASETARQPVRPLRTTTYQVQAIAPNGCRAVDQVTVRVRVDLPVYIANAFSPNGDGQNDVFFVQSGRQVLQVRSFQIFNRWGTLVFGREQFQPNDPAFGWDGYFQGKLMPTGAYVYYVLLEMTDGREEMLKGEVLLLR